MTISRWTVGPAVGISAVALAACTSIPRWQHALPFLLRRLPRPRRSRFLFRSHAPMPTSERSLPS